MNQESISKSAGTLELRLELKGLPGVLAGVEQIRFAAEEAAAAVASIGAMRAVSSLSPAEKLAAEWKCEIRSGISAYGMPARTEVEFISALTKLLSG